MQDADPLITIKALEKTVGAIMEKIQDCLAFLNGYEEKSLSGILYELWSILWSANLQYSSQSSSRYWNYTD